MRLLGFLFLMILLFVGVGLYQGWISFDTTHAAGKDDVTVALDKGKLKSDAKALGDRLGKAAGDAIDKARSLGRSNGKASELDGTVQDVDATARKVTLAAGAEVLQLSVPSSARLTRGAGTLPLEQLRPGDLVRVTMEDVGARWEITAIDIRS